MDVKRVHCFKFFVHVEPAKWPFVVLVEVTGVMRLGETVAYKDLRRGLMYELSLPVRCMYRARRRLGA